MGYLVKLSRSASKPATSEAADREPAARAARTRILPTELLDGSNSLSPWTTRSPRLTCASDGYPRRRLLVRSKALLVLEVAICSWHVAPPRSNLSLEIGRGMICGPEVERCDGTDAGVACPEHPQATYNGF
jgi:hypothetical protein